MNINQPAENIVLPFMRKKKINLADPHQVEKHRRIQLVKILPPALRGHIVAGLGEFVGTFMFLFLAFSATQVANFVVPGAATAASAPNTSNLLYISLAFGFSLAVNAWVFFRISGGLFNPAVTLGMALIGAVTWIRAGVVLIAQIIGAIAAAGVVSALFPGPLSVRTTLSSKAQGAVVTTTIVQGLFIEMFLTAELVFTIFMLAAEKHKATFIAPVGIGLALFVCEMCGVFFTGGSLNPARSFGPAVVAGEFTGYHWIYWVGPFLGSLVAVAFYKLVKGLEYETVNPGADENAKEAEHFVDGEVTPMPVVAMAHGDQTAQYATIPLQPAIAPTEVHVKPNMYTTPNTHNVASPDTHNVPMAHTGNAHLRPFRKEQSEV